MGPTLPSGRTRALVLAGAIALGVALPARADSSASRGDAPEDEPPVELPEIEVCVPRAEVEKDPTASATVVSATRFEGEAKDVAELLSTAPASR